VAVEVPKPLDTGGEGADEVGSLGAAPLLEFVHGVADTGPVV